MTNATTNPLTDDSENKKGIIDKIVALKDLLSISVPTDNQANYVEYTKYEAVFDASERQTIKDKIMSLISEL